MTIRFPAEWETQQAVLLAWPHEQTDWSYMLHETIECYKKIVQHIVQDEDVVIITPNIQQAKVDLKDIVGRCPIHFFQVPTNDTWARDFGAITVWHDDTPVHIDFKFNAWGMKFSADKDNLINRNLELCNLFKGKIANEMDFVLEGGSIESDGCGTLLTTSQCLLSPNRNGGHTQAQIEAHLKKVLGIEKVLWLNHGEMAGDDTDSHIDTLARLAPRNTILYNGNSATPSHTNTSLDMMKEDLSTFTNAQGQKFNLVELPVPAPIVDEEGYQLPATYANFLIMNHQVLVPTYNQPKLDELALSIIKTAFPDRHVCGIDCNALIKQHGSLHCVTMQFPANSLNL